MKWTLLGFIIIASLQTAISSSSSYNSVGYNYITPQERQLLVTKVNKIQSFLFPDQSPRQPEIFENEIERLPVSLQCKQFLKNYQNARFSDRVWTHELEDAQGKLSGGVMKGNLEYVGDFDECVNLKVGTEADPWDDYSSKSQPVFRGRYCTVAINLKANNVSQGMSNSLRGYKADKVGRLGLCTLTACSKDDISKLVATKFDDESTSLQVTACDGPEEWSLASTPSLIRIAFGALAILLVLGTILHQITGNSDEIEKPFWLEMLTSFSVTRNLRLILVENETPQQSKFINVLKAICMLLVLHGHGPLTIRFVSLNSITAHYYMLTGPFQAVINAGFLSVDFFLFTSAFISVKIVLPRFKSLIEQKASLSTIISNAAFVLGYRYMRVIPSLVFLMMMHVYSENLIVGPFWREYSEKYLAPCRNQWLPNILMLTNVLPWNPEEPNCVFHSWYLGLDMQLFIFSLVFFIILAAIKPKLAIILNLVFLGLGIAAKGIMTYYYNYPPTVLFGHREREGLYFSQMYTKPWFRADPYILGLLFGYFTISGHQLNISKRVKIGIHVLVIAAMFSILKVPTYYHDVESFSSFNIAAFGALHRAVWALCLGWIFNSAYAQDFPILTTISNWHIWEILSNVSYQFFLFHPLAFFLHFGAHKSHFSIGQLPLYLSLIGVCLLLFIATIFLPLIVEWPISNMMKTVKNRLSSPKVKKVD